MDIADVDSAHSLFQLQRIPFQNRFNDRVLTFFDSGSNMNLVTEDFARRARLKGQPMLQSLFTTGGKVSEWTTKAYFVPLIHRWGKIQEVLAYSIGIITSPTKDADLRPALREFPELRGDYWKIRRPTGDVNLLIGIQDAGLHPYLTNPAEHCKGNLQLLTSMFGTGYLLDSSHPEIKVEPHHFSSGARKRI